MIDYQSETEIMEAIEILSHGDAQVKEALIELLTDQEGGKILKKYLEFPRITLTPEELWKTYAICCSKNLRLFVATMDLIEEYDPGMVHANLKSDKPIKFVEYPVRIPEKGSDRTKCVKLIRNNFEKRYRLSII